jgi:hypothetical protein
MEEAVVDYRSKLVCCGLLVLSSSEIQTDEVQLTRNMMVSKQVETGAETNRS